MGHKPSASAANDAALGFLARGPGAVDRRLRDAPELWEEALRWPLLPLDADLFRWLTLALSLTGDILGSTRPYRQQARLFVWRQLRGRAGDFLAALAQSEEPCAQEAWERIMEILDFRAGRSGSFPTWMCQRVQLQDQWLLAAIFPALATLNPARHAEEWYRPGCRGLEDIHRRFSEDAAFQDEDPVPKA